MKRLERRVKRGKARIFISEFVKNNDGTKKVIFERKTRRGKWVAL